MSYNNVYTDEEFRELYRKFNSIFGDYRQWSDHCARKIHTDEFGKEIKRGEVYFTRAYGYAWGEDYKVSRESMETIFQLLFSNHSLVNDICQHFLDLEVKKQHEAMQKFSF